MSRFIPRKSGSPRRSIALRAFRFHDKGACTGGSPELVSSVQTKRDHVGVVGYIRFVLTYTEV